MVRASRPPTRTCQSEGCTCQTGAFRVRRCARPMSESVIASSSETNFIEDLKSASQGPACSYQSLGVEGGALGCHG